MAKNNISVKSQIFVAKLQLQFSPIRIRSFLECMFYHCKLIYNARLSVQPVRVIVLPVVRNSHNVSKELKVYNQRTNVSVV